MVDVGAEPLAAALGELIGGYRLDSVIGQGGMGTVFLGTHAMLGRKAAVKVLSARLAADQDYIARFFQEARVAAEARHPNVVDIVDYVSTVDPRRVAFVMELIEGPALSEVLRSRRLDLVQAAHIGLQLADALTAVHALGVVHRDLKPDNILIVGDLAGDLSPVPSCKVLDFGIAKATDLGSGALTAAGMILGTPAYMAPEQITGQQVSAATDVYAMGELLYEMLTAERLFAGPQLDILQAKVGAEAPLIRLPPELPCRTRLIPLITACLASREADRPTTQDLQAGLRDILAASAGLPAVTPPMTSVPPSVGGGAAVGSPLNDPSTWKTDRRRRAMTVWMAVAAVGVAVAFAAGLLFGEGRDFPLFDQTPEAVPVQITPLNPPSPVPDPVRVQVQTYPFGALVVDVATGKELGIAPLAVTLEGGASRRVEVRNLGFRSAQVELSSEVEAIEVRLEAERSGGATAPSKPIVVEKRAPAPARASPPVTARPPDPGEQRPAPKTAPSPPAARATPAKAPRSKKRPEPSSSGAREPVEQRAEPAATPPIADAAPPATEAPVSRTTPPVRVLHGRLRQALLVRGLTFPDLLESAPVDARTWGRWLRGKVQPDEGLKQAHYATLLNAVERVEVDRGLLNRKLARAKKALDGVAASKRNERHAALASRYDDLVDAVADASPADDLAALAAQISRLELDTHRHRRGR